MSRLSKAFGKTLRKGMSADYSVQGIIDTIRVPNSNNTGTASTPKSRQGSQVLFSTNDLLENMKNNEDTCSLVHVLGKQTLWKRSHHFGSVFGSTRTFRD